MIHRPLSKLILHSCLLFRDIKCLQFNNHHHHCTTNQSKTGKTQTNISLPSNRFHILCDLCGVVRAIIGDANTIRSEINKLKRYNDQQQCDKFPTFIKLAVYDNYDYNHWQGKYLWKIVCLFAII